MLTPNRFQVIGPIDLEPHTSVKWGVLDTLENEVAPYQHVSEAEDCLRHWKRGHWESDQAIRSCLWWVPFGFRQAVSLTRRQNEIRQDAAGNGPDQIGLL
jgi:hypothetical protein